MPPITSNEKLEFEVKIIYNSILQKIKVLGYKFNTKCIESIHGKVHNSNERKRIFK